MTGPLSVSLSDACPRVWAQAGPTQVPARGWGPSAPGSTAGCGRDLSSSASPELVVCPREGRIPRATCALGHVGTGGGRGRRRLETAQAQTRGSRVAPLGARRGGPGARGDGGRLARGLCQASPQRGRHEAVGLGRRSLAQPGWGPGVCSPQGPRPRPRPQGGTRQPCDSPATGARGCEGHSGRCPEALRLRRTSPGAGSGVGGRA